MIGIQDFDIEKLKAELREMSDAELIEFGQGVRDILRVKRVSPFPDSWQQQLDAARQEWRRRHPRGA